MTIKRTDSKHTRADKAGAKQTTTKLAMVQTMEERLRQHILAKRAERKERTC